MKNKQNTVLHSFSVVLLFLDTLFRCVSFAQTLAVPWDNETKIQASDKEGDDRFGCSVSISGDFAIVGAWREDTGGDSAGSAYIFKRTGNYNWDTGTKIQASDKEEYDYFGFGVSISGDYAIVGAEGEDTGGSAYIFKRTGDSTWDNGTKIQASDKEEYDEFGHSVSISGDYAIVGASREDTGGNAAGSAYIFKRTGDNTWDTGTKIQASDKETGDYFGRSVSIRGDYAIVGAAYGSIAGAAYIFKRTGDNTWDSGTKIQASDKEAADFFGLSVSISGDYAIVGAVGEDTGGDMVGAAYIFKRTGDNTWDTGTKIQASDKEAGDHFGNSVSICGDYAIVGAGDEGTGGDWAGAAYIFNRTGDNTWDNGTKIQASDKEGDDRFGYSVSISGDFAIVGADQEDTGGYRAGSAYIFKLSGEETIADTYSETASETTAFVDETEYDTYSETTDDTYSETTADTYSETRADTYSETTAFVDETESDTYSDTEVVISDTNAVTDTSERQGEGSAVLAVGLGVVLGVPLALLALFVVIVIFLIILLFFLLRKKLIKTKDDESEGDAELGNIDPNLELEEEAPSETVEGEDKKENLEALGSDALKTEEIEIPEKNAQVVSEKKETVAKETVEKGEKEEKPKEEKKVKLKCYYKDKKYRVFFRGELLKIGKVVKVKFETIKKMKKDGKVVTLVVENGESIEMSFKDDDMMKIFSEKVQEQLDSFESETESDETSDSEYGSNTESDESEEG